MYNHHIAYKDTKRLSYETNNPLDLISYIFTRSRQLLWLSDIRLENVLLFDWGALAYFKNKEGNPLSSLYLYSKSQGLGLYPKLYKELISPHRIVTLRECNISGYLDKKDIPYVIYTTDVLPCYKIIENFYANTRAKRSNILYMNHIDEGLYILQEIQAKEATLNAFCLHPIFQEDSNLQSAYAGIKKFKQKAVESSGEFLEYILLAMEYRNIANQYLSRRSIDSISDINLSPVSQVNQMLVADKIQNQKDFYLSQEKHPRYKDLNDYFNNWLDRLNVKNNPSVLKAREELTRLDKLESDLIISLSNKR